MMNKSYKFLIIGVGSIGKKYLEIINKNYHLPEITCLRRTSKKININKNVKIINNFDKVEKKKFNLVIISSPANLHYNDFKSSINLSKNFIIEKPISNNLKDAKKIYSLAKNKKLKVLIGYNLLFDEKIQYLKKILKRNKLPIQHINIECQSFLPDWRKNISYKKSVSANKKLGGGVMLELSHEISYVLYLFGEIKYIYGITYNTNNMKIDVEDFAEIIAITTKNYPIRIHLNFNSQIVKRKCEINIFKKFISLDLIKNQISIKKNNHIEIKKFKNNLDFTYKKQIDFLINNNKSSSIDFNKSLKNALLTISSINSIKKSKHNIKKK